MEARWRQGGGKVEDECTQEADKVEDECTQEAGKVEARWREHFLSYVRTYI